MKDLAPHGSSKVKRTNERKGRARELYPEVVHLPDLVDAVSHQLHKNRITYIRRPNRAGRRTGRADLRTGASGRGRLTRSPAKAPATTKVTYTPLRRITRRYMPSQRPMVVGGGGMRGGRWRLGTRRRVWWSSSVSVCVYDGKSRGISGDFYRVIC
jgi:hypothetical protein